jgi:hypothetical protein
MEILAMAFEIDDRISNQLSGPMEGGVPTALNLEKLYSFALEKLRRSGEVLLLECSTECHDRWMLNEKEHILRNGSRDAVAGDATLELERFPVAQSAQRNCP